MGVAGAMGAAAGQVMAKNNALSAQGAANLRTAKNYITSMNYSLQNLQMERQDAFEASVEDLMKVRKQGGRQQASVSAAVNEGMMGGGRTANAINRAALSDTADAAKSVVSNYQRKSNEIDLNREATLLSTKNAINNIKEVEKPSLLSTLFSLGTAYIGARNAQENIQAMRVKAGVSADTPLSFDYQPSYENVLFGKTTFYTPQRFNFNIENPYLKTTFKFNNLG